MSWTDILVELAPAALTALAGLAAGDALGRRRAKASASKAATEAALRRARR